MNNSIERFTVEDTAAGRIESRVLAPRHGREPLPVLYLLHGRGGTAAEWDGLLRELDDRMASGRLAPLLAVALDGPWSLRGHWWVDSAFTGNAEVPPGSPVATAFLEQFVPAVDRAFSTIAEREGRVIAGVSMGGAGALQFALGHPGVFARAIALSPAVYAPEPAAASTTRQYGAFGRGAVLFDGARYRELGYRAALDRIDARTPLVVQLAVGDDEGVGAEPDHDLVVEAARLQAALRRAPGIRSELRVLGGAHEWSLWNPALLDALDRLPIGRPGGESATRAR